MATEKINIQSDIPSNFMPEVISDYCSGIGKNTVLCSNRAKTHAQMRQAEWSKLGKDGQEKWKSSPAGSALPAIRQKAKDFFEENKAKGYRAYRFKGHPKVSKLGLFELVGYGQSGQSTVSKGNVIYATNETTTWGKDKGLRSVTRLNSSNPTLNPRYITTDFLNNKDLFDDITETGLYHNADGFLSAEGSEAIDGITVSSKSSNTNSAGNKSQFVFAGIVIAVVGGLYYWHTTHSSK